MPASTWEEASWQLLDPLVLALEVMMQANVGANDAKAQRRRLVLLLLLLLEVLLLEVLALGHAPRPQQQAWPTALVQGPTC